MCYFFATTNLKTCITSVTSVFSINVTITAIHKRDNYCDSQETHVPWTKPLLCVGN